MAEEELQSGPLQSIGIDLSVEASESFIKELDASGTSLRNLGGDLVTFTDNAKAFNAALLRMGTTIGLVNQSLGKTNKLSTSIKALSEVAATSEKMRASAADAATSINLQARAIDNLAAMSGGFLYLEAITRKDLRESCDLSRTDTSIHARTGAWYRKRLRAHYQFVGAGLWYVRDGELPFYELEAGT